MGEFQKHNMDCCIVDISAICCKSFIAIFIFAVFYVNMPNSCGVRHVGDSTSSARTT